MWHGVDQSERSWRQRVILRRCQCVEQENKKIDLAKIVSKVAFYKVSYVSLVVIYV
jgi:hypothetical protein